MIKHEERGFPISSHFSLPGNDDALLYSPHHGSRRIALYAASGIEEESFDRLIIFKISSVKYKSLPIEIKFINIMHVN